MHVVLKYLLSLFLILGLGLNVGYSTHKSATNHTSVAFDRKITRARRGISVHFLKLLRKSAIPIFQIVSQNLSLIFSQQVVELLKKQQRTFLYSIHLTSSHFLVQHQHHAHLKPLPVAYIS